MTAFKPWRPLLVGLGLFICAAVGTAVIAPQIAIGMSDTDHPSYLVLAATGVVLIALTSAFLGYASRVMGLGQAWLVWAIIYNALIVVVKFVVSPVALYRTTFVEGGFDLGPSVKQTATYAVFAGFAFVLYACTLLVVYRSHLKRVRAATRDPAAPAPHRGLGRRALIVLVTIVVLGPTVLTLLILSGAYVAALLAIAGVALILLLVGALVSGFLAFDEVSTTAVSLHNVALLTTFFWVGFSLLLVYHVVWVVYTAILVSIWPLKTVVPASGK